MNEATNHGIYDAILTMGDVEINAVEEELREMLWFEANKAGQDRYGGYD